MRGSGDARSIHGLVNAMSCDMLSLGVNGVSTGLRGGTRGIGWCLDGVEPSR